MPVLRDIALILLALEGAVFTLAVVAILAAINYGLFYVRWWHNIPRYFAIARGYLHLGKGIIEGVCHRIATPVFGAAKVQATLAGMANGLFDGQKEPEK